MGPATSHKLDNPAAVASSPGHEIIRAEVNGRDHHAIGEGFDDRTPCVEEEGAARRGPRGSGPVPGPQPYLPFGWGFPPGPPQLAAYFISQLVARPFLLPGTRARRLDDPAIARSAKGMPAAGSRVRDLALALAPGIASPGSRERGTIARLPTTQHWISQPTPRVGLTTDKLQISCLCDFNTTYEGANDRDRNDKRDRISRV
jgi:hypothetical protein